jgi:eukaryotic-like serine/threonine-protein kinase
MSARFSPDGRWVAYMSPESGEEEIYVDSFPVPQRKIRMSTSGGDYPVWSSDGRELYYVQPGNQLMAVRVETGGAALRPSAPKQLFILPVHDSSTWPFDVAKDGRFLVRADAQQGSRSLTAILNWRSLLK